MAKLIDLAYSTDCCHVVGEALNDAQLSRFCAESGFVLGARRAHRSGSARYGLPCSACGAGHVAPVPRLSRAHEMSCTAHVLRCAGVGVWFLRRNRFPVFMRNAVQGYATAKGEKCEVYPAPFGVRLFEKDGDRPEDVAKVNVLDGCFVELSKVFSE